jgi:hypothetical protein
MSMGVYIVIGLVTLGIIVWLATSGVWMILKWVGRTTHLDEPIDRFFDVEGELDSADYLKSKEKHPHGDTGRLALELSDSGRGQLHAVWLGARSIDSALTKSSVPTNRQRIVGSVSCVGGGPTRRDPR